MERFLNPDAPAVVSVYAPITFPPTGVLLFKQRDDGEMKSPDYIWKQVNLISLVALILNFWPSIFFMFNWDI